MKKIEKKMHCIHFIFYNDRIWIMNCIKYQNFISFQKDSISLLIKTERNVYMSVN